MQNRKIVLASKSPRRKKLLEQIGLKFAVRESAYEEDLSARSNPYELVKFLAMKKGEDVARHYRNAIIIAADTIVVFRNKIIGKPKNLAEAKKMIKEFSGSVHEIVTGFAIIDTKNRKKVKGFSKGKVKFSRLDNEEINRYLARAEVLDKAGAYAIQEEASAFIREVSGDYHAIVGLPVFRVAQELRKMGVKIF